MTNALLKFRKSLVLLAILTVLGLSIIGFSYRSSNGTGLAEMYRYVNSLGYQAYTVPRSNWGPGYVFMAEIQGEGGKTRLVVDTLRPEYDKICRTIYPNSSIHPSDLSPPDKVRTSNLDLDASLSLLQDFIGNKNKARANLGKFGSITAVNIKLTGMKEWEIYQEDLYQPNGKRLPIRSACFSAIQSEKEKGNLPKLYVITEAVSVDGLDYDFIFENDFQAELELNWNKILDFYPEVKYSKLSGNTLRISERRFIGYGKPRKLIDWVPTGAVSAAATEVKVTLGEPVDLPIAFE